MIAWAEPPFEAQAAPRRAIGLVQQALAAAPSNPRLLAELGNLHFDRYAFAAAAEAYAGVLAIDPRRPAVRARLALCYRELGRAADGLPLLSPAQLVGEEASDPALLYARAEALAAAGRSQEAEAELEAVLAACPGHAHALASLAGLLRRSCRTAELLARCEALAACGLRHTRLLFEWGRAMALCGDPRAPRLMLDPARIHRRQLPPPAPFDTAEAFAAAFADELSAHPIPLSRLPRGDANRGSRRVHQLIGGARPQLARALVPVLQSLVDDLLASLAPAEGFDPWREAAPARARLNGWGLLQRAGDHEAWHLHQGGWLSGVCYLRLPRPLSAEGDGAGCIEYGPPPSLAGLAPCAPLRIAPVETLVLLAPSHYLHRTLPFGDDGERISFAFDVAPAA